MSKIVESIKISIAQFLNHFLARHGQFFSLLHNHDAQLTCTETPVRRIAAWDGEANETLDTANPNLLLSLLQREFKNGSKFEWIDDHHHHLGHHNQQILCQPNANIRKVANGF